MHYDKATIYDVYLYNEAKMIPIKYLRIFKNVDEKKYGKIHLFDIIISLKFTTNSKSKIKSTFSSISAPNLVYTSILLASVTNLSNITSNLHKSIRSRFGHFFKLL